jgi:hypothetical protein
MKISSRTIKSVRQLSHWQGSIHQKAMRPLKFLYLMKEQNVQTLKLERNL